LKTKLTEPLKIISIGPAPPLRGGISRFNESFSAALKKAGVDVEMVSFRFLYPRLLFPGKTQFSGTTAPEGMNIHPLIHPLNPLNWIRVAREIIKFRPDIVVFHYWMPFFAPAYGTISRRLKKSSEAGIFAVVHNLIPHEKQPGAAMLTRFFLRPLNGVVTLSSSVLKDLEALLPGSRGLFMPHPVYDIFGEIIGKGEARKFLGLDPGYSYLLFFGLVRDYKGLDLLLNSLTFVNSNEYRLIIAGEFYGNKSKYQEIISDNHLDNFVLIRDEYIPDDEVKYYFCAADLVVQPYKSATQSGITQMAYHFERPMLVTRVGGLPEIVPQGKAGYVVNPAPEDIGAAINEFLMDKRKERFLSFIRKEKEKYSWKNFIESFLNFISLNNPSSQ
jgi:D-inositol-3-phosphate glycosyltransferase